MRWRPWERLARAANTPDGDTGGREARERAERALEDVRRRREEALPLRLFFRGEKLANHFREDVEHIWEARR